MRGFAIDETWVFVRDTFGEFRLGEKEGQASNLRFAVPAVGNGQADGDFGRYIDDQGVFGTDFIDSADDAKISYIGMFGGFTVGASYSPTTGQRFSNPAFTDNDGDFENIFSVGANYKGDFGGTSIGVSGGFATGDFEENQDRAPPLLGNDLQEFGVGGEVGFGGIVVGGFYINSEGGAVDDRDRYRRRRHLLDRPLGVCAPTPCSPSRTPWTARTRRTRSSASAWPSTSRPASRPTPTSSSSTTICARLSDNDGTVFLTGITASF